MTTTLTQTEVSCPKCGGATWDNRTSKRNPRQPDFKCKNRACDGVIWPPRESRTGQRAQQAPQNGRQGYDIPPAGTMPYDGPVSHAPQPTEQAPETEATTRFKNLVNVQRACFRAALRLASDANAAGVPVSLEGVSALTAQLLIAYNEGH
jgi:hypothetical protein